MFKLVIYRQIAVIFRTIMLFVSVGVKNEQVSSPVLQAHLDQVLYDSLLFLIWNLFY